MRARQAVLRFVFGAVLAAACQPCAVRAAENGGDNLIRIIQDDGSVVDFQIPPLNKAPETPAAAPSSVQTEKKPVEPARPIRKEAAEKKEHVAKEKAVKREPAGKQASTAIVRTKAGVPLPPRKPSRAAAASAEPAAPRRTEQPVFTPGMEVTREVARRLALREAPPARRIDISRGVYKDRPVYDVVFATEDGRYSVLVDAQTGDILGKGYE